jgi:hypothetical protein
MAEVLAALGGASACLQLSSSLLKVARELRRCARDLRYAKQEIQLVEYETSFYSDSLMQFLNLLEKSPVAAPAVANEQSGTRGLRNRKKTAQRLMRWSNAVLGNLKSLLKKVRALSSRTDIALWTKAMAYVKWFTEKGSVKCLQASLSAAREQITILMGLEMWEELRHQHTANMTSSVNQSQLEARL